jgi:hypothetical protein
MKNDSFDNNASSTVSRKDGNRGLIAVLLVSLLLVFVVGAIVLTRSNKKNTEEATMMENQKLELATQLSQRDSIINEWVLAFNEIESDIRKITARENMLTLQSMNPEISADKKAEIIKEIQVIRDLIDQNKKRIASLNSQLRKSGINIASLQARIDTMDATITQRDNDISALKMELVDRDFEIGQLHKEVDTMKTVVADKEYTIANQTDEMNKAYVISGTYKDLKEKGLLDKEGGILGIGGKEALQENALKDDMFTQVDITETTTIPVNSKSVKLVTDHPANSYELVKGESDMIAFIEIKDPTMFWKISKYAVVEVNK